MIRSGTSYFLFIGPLRTALNVACHLVVVKQSLLIGATEGSLLLPRIKKSQDRETFSSFVNLCETEDQHGEKGKGALT